jgi:hypothetical protein
MIDTKGNYYLGRIYDPQTDKATAENYLYDPADLTTHAVVVGMTGSGKTGLCIDLMEEAALSNVPALIIDPKGDITNLLLHFPELQPADFQPWINADQARRDGKTVDQAAADTADLWRNGLADWSIEGDRIQALQDSVRFTIYTPGSNAGVALSVLSSLDAPDVPWAGNEEVLSERINNTAAALLSQVGFNEIDPVQSREHILLANLFQTAWSAGKNLPLEELILQIQTPPFTKLGVMDVEALFPQKDRAALAMRLNNMLASPSFQTWLQGEPMDIARLLYEPDGRPRHSVFYLAHLNDEQRMFFVTLLFAAVETWMRTQAGTTSLRALVYFDEIFGYLPAVGNPPSKGSMLRMLKQARAFGVGLVLATQNPVDIDYKGLSNAGTWFIGRLATDQDKNRLIDGLLSAVGGAADRREFDRLISGIGKRVFLARNVHAKEPQLFQTRWAMNYLAGPMTRNQIPALNELAGASPAAATTPAPATAEPEPASAEATTTPAVTTPPPSKPAGGGTETRPAVPSGLAEIFLPANVTAPAPEAPILYRPALFAQAGVRVANARYDVNTIMPVTVLVTAADPKGVIPWETHEARALTAAELSGEPLPGARFAGLDRPYSDGGLMKSLSTEFKDWVYENKRVIVRANEMLKVYAAPDVSDEVWEEQRAEAADDAMDAELDKLKGSYESKIKSLQTKLAKEEAELAEDEAELSGRKVEEWAKHAETLLGILGKRRRSVSSSLTKRRMTAKAKEDVEESIQAIAEFQADIAELQAELEKALDEVEAKWQAVADEESELPLKPTKSNITIEQFGVAWLPYYQVDGGEVAAFALE